MIEEFMSSEQFEEFLKWADLTYRLNKTSLARKLNTSQQNISAFTKRPVSKNILRKLKEVFPEYPLFNKITNINSNYVLEQPVLNSDIVPVPMYEALVAAGQGETPVTDFPQKDVINFDRKFLKYIVGAAHLNSLSVVQTKGDSMDTGDFKTNNIKDRDYLLVDNAQIEGENKIFIIRMNGELRVKRILFNMDGSLIIKSDNPAYPEEKYNKGESLIEIEVLGRVIWNLSRGEI